MKKTFLLPLAALFAYTFGFLYLIYLAKTPLVSLSPGEGFFSGFFSSNIIANVTIIGLLVFAILILFITSKKKK